MFSSSNSDLGEKLTWKIHKKANLVVVGRENTGNSMELATEKYSTHDSIKSDFFSTVQQFSLMYDLIVCTW